MKRKVFSPPCQAAFYDLKAWFEDELCSQIDLPMYNRVLKECFAADAAQYAACSKIRESQALNDFASNLTPAFPGHVSPLIGKLGLLNGKDQITFAERSPVQPIGSVQYDFGGTGGPPGLFGRTQQHVYLRVIGHSAVLGDNDCGMRLRPARRMP
jgi:hypothetical protein